MLSGNLRIGTVLLAAGGSSRLGQPKQLLSWEGESLLRRAAKTARASGSSSVVVVLGSQANRMQQEIEDLPVERVINSSWETGMASSVRTGVQALLMAPAPPDAAIFLLCDQPHLTPAILHALMEIHGRTEKPAVVSQYASGSTGVPCLFAASLFPELLTLTGEQGAKRLVARLPDDQVAYVPFPKGDCDIDTPEDWQRTLSNVPSPV
jgi:molybdenum cofactor cytidylyltransferase